ncbi:uncharacterized protein BJX67DRAFT_306096 [Aspergillus lucknowensis]|uniref:ceramidase n=1 Tax=Aspergillus lucknowensis TaxID=176173 RepID=A0ABR4LZW0_9EURO
MPAVDPGDIPPTHIINLSLPPARRYTRLAALYTPQLRSITSIFDSLVLEIFPPSYLPWIKSLARIFLRRVYDNEESEEIRGIAQVTGIDLYLVVCLNVLLDLLMGCTSGAALYKPNRSSRSREGNESLADGEGAARLLHFRTLDWDMPALRQLVVKLQYVDSDAEDAHVLATNITYVGFVGVLTGVRPGLSVSLNFRPNHDGDSWLKHLKYYGSIALVLLGWRRSISSVLRQVIIPSRPRNGLARRVLSGLGWLFLSLFVGGRKKQAVNEASLTETVSRILRTPSTACYLVLCDGQRAYVLEKDYKTRTVESSSSFIVATNSDRKVGYPQAGDHSTREQHTGASLVSGDPVLMTDFIKDSIERRECMQAHWDMKVTTARQAIRRASQARSDPLKRTRSSQSRDICNGFSSSSSYTTPPSITPSEPEITATLDEIVSWTSRYPTTNETTHFATVLDPAKGTVAWIRRYPEPLDCSWEMTDFD